LLLLLLLCPRLVPLRQGTAYRALQAQPPIIRCDSSEELASLRRAPSVQEGSQTAK
jgi:hypothetical protein